MNSSFDPVGLLVVVAVVTALALLVRAVSAGRMKRVLKKVLFGIILIVAGMLLWNTLISLT